MTDLVLWTGVVTLAGALAAAAARALGVPAAAGSLLGGFVVVAAARGAGLMQTWPDLGPIRSLLAALLCFLLGAELDLTRLARQGASIAIAAASQAAAVLGLVWAAGLLLGLDGGSSLVLAAAATAASPIAIIAVSSESRARGDLTQRSLALAVLSLLAAMVAGGLATGAMGGALRIGAGLLAGALCGAVILMPLSRMAMRGAILACAGGGALLLAAVGSRFAPGGAALVLMSAVAGFMAGNLIPNRELVREALRDMALPAAAALFAASGSSLLAEEIAAALLAGGVVVAARAGGLLLGGLAARGAQQGALEAAALVPMSGALAYAPLLIGAAPPHGASGVDALGILVAAGFLSEAAGMIGVRWALVRSGEAAPLAEDPDAWRAPMR